MTTTSETDTDQFVPGPIDSALSQSSSGMFTPAPGDTIYQRITWVNAQVAAVGKNLKNIEAGYGARSIDDVMVELHPLLAQAGVTVPYTVLKAKMRDVKIGRKETTMREATLRVRFRFTGPLGDELIVEAQSEALDAGDKATNKALTAALKYALLTLFTIPVADQTDADERTHERSAAGDGFRSESEWEELQVLIDELEHAPVDVAGQMAERYVDKVWAGRSMPWVACPPGWVPKIVQALRTAVAEYDPGLPLDDDAEAIEADVTVEAG